MCKEQGMFQKGQLSKLAGMDVPHMQALTEVRVPLLYRQAPSDITGLQDIITGTILSAPSVLFSQQLPSYPRPRVLE